MKADIRGGKFAEPGYRAASGGERNVTESAARCRNRDSDRSRVHTSLFALIYFVYFLSGAAGLIYQISWARQIGLLFGHTAHAAAVVLSSYFAGMAIGYLVGAKWSSRVSPLVGYAIAELIVAGWAFLIPLLLAASESSTIAPWLSSSSFAWQLAVRALFSFLLLLPATIALGATLPMMAVFFSSTGEGKMADTTDASRVTMAYALNTAGALGGVSLASFYLLVNVGVRSSSYVAAVLSVFCALVALAVWRRNTTDEMKDSPLATRPNPSHLVLDNFGHSTLDSKLIMTLAFVSGFGTLALQVIYTRMFSLVFHNSTYTFGVVIAVFLASLALGAALASRLQSRICARRLVGVATGLGALATVLSVLVFVWLTELKYFSCGSTFLQYISGAVLLVIVVVAPAITCLGMLLPLTWTLAGQSGSAGHVVGKLTAVNTLAGSIGAIAASFCLLTWVGLWQSIVLVSILFFIAAFILLWNGRQKWFACVLGLLLSVSSVFVLSSPVEAEFDRTEYGERLIRRWNSSYGWIDVVQREETGDLKIRQNLHYRFGTTGTNAREYRQAHIPLLLHGRPRDVLFLGLGTGLTAGGAIPHEDVESIVAVELIPDVVEAARVLAKYNYDVADHSKVKIHIDDARHYLLANERQFDTIVSDLFVPWESESGYLYTVEHYQIASQRLKPGGLFCQWLPLYQIGEREFESIANSFASVFPYTTIWWGQLETMSPVVALIGTPSPLKIDAKRLETRLNSLGRHLMTSDPTIATPGRFWDLYIGDWELKSSSNLNTDEHPRVEFIAPISNRDGKMIRGNGLEVYYNRVLSQLPADAAQLIGNTERIDKRDRVARQRLILFGE